MVAEPIRVLFDAHQIGRRQTGNETYVRELLAELGTRDGLSLTALLEDAAMLDAPLAPRVGRRRVPRSGLRRLAAMTRLARRARPDVLHAIYFAPYLAGVPVVLTVHDISYEFHPEFFSRSSLIRDRLLIRDSAHRARLVVTVSEASRRDLIERYGLRENRVVAIHNGVAPRFFDLPAPEIEPIGERPVRILAIGTLQPRKNLLRLLEAVRQVSMRRPVILRVVGPDGHGAGVIREALAGARGVAVDIVGYVADEELPREYAAADMLVYPSIYEGFGLPVVEAMASGLPVVTSTGGALPEVAGDAAVLVDPLDVAAMATAIMRLVEDDGMRQDLSVRGRERARRFSWAASADAHIAAYRTVTGA